LITKGSIETKNGYRHVKLEAGNKTRVTRNGEVDLEQESERRINVCEVCETLSGKGTRLKVSTLCMHPALGRRQGL